MTHGEFQEWVKFFGVTFPDFNGWLDKQADAGAILDRWSGWFSRITMRHAKEAVDKLADAETRPVGFQNYIFAVRKYAREIERDDARRKGRGDTIRCRDCRDTGTLEVFTVGRQLQKAIERYGTELAARQTASVRCYCDAGGNAPSATPPFVKDAMIVVKGHATWYATERPDVWNQRLGQVEEAAGYLLSEQGS